MSVRRAEARTTATWVFPEDEVATASRLTGVMDASQ
jgi:hypothetical protein